MTDRSNSAGPLDRCAGLRARSVHRGRTNRRGLPCDSGWWGWVSETKSRRSIRVNLLPDVLRSWESGTGPRSRKGDRRAHRR